MPIGEDIPMLIPISIVLVIFLLFLFSLFTNFSDQSNIIKMSQVSLNIGEYLINTNSDNFGNILSSKLNEYNYAKHDCFNKLSELDMSSNYKVRIKIEDFTRNDVYCWGNVQHSNDVVTNSLPTLIIENGQTRPAMVIVSVGK